MEHLLEVIKIIRHGAAGQVTQMAAYVEQLAGKLEEDGEQEQANRIRRALTGFSPLLYLAMGDRNSLESRVKELLLELEVEKDPERSYFKRNTPFEASVLFCRTDGYYTTIHGKAAVCDPDDFNREKVEQEIFEDLKRRLK